MKEGKETDPFLVILSPDGECGFLHNAAEDLFDLVTAWSPGGSHRSSEYWLVIDYCIAAWHRDNFAVRKVLDREGITVAAVNQLIVEALAANKSFVELASEVVGQVMATATRSQRSSKPMG